MISLVLALLTAAPSVAVIRSSTKVGPNAIITSRPAEIHCARGEAESFQVVVGGDTGLPGLHAASLNFALDGGAATISATIYREATIQITTPSNAEGSPGAWPDPLILMNGPVDVPAGGRVILWVEVKVPSTAVAGTYRGQLTISSGTWHVDIPVTLVVWPFTIPPTPTLPSLIGFSPDAVCRWNGAAQFCADNATSETVNAQYAKFLLDYRLSLRLYSTPTADLTASLADWDAHYAGLLAGPTHLTAVNFPWFPWHGTPAADQAQRYAQFWQHVSTSPVKLVDWIWDEPKGDEWTALTTRAQFAKAYGPGFLTLVTTDIDTLHQAGIEGLVDILVPVLDQVDDWNAGNQRSKYDEWENRTNAEVWGYQSCDQHGCTIPDDLEQFTGWPSLTIDSSGVQNRAQPWMHFLYYLKGLLYYQSVQAYDHVSHAADFGGSDLYQFTGNGDGTLIYPGPVPSLRLALLRDGMEDYEYLRLCEKASKTKARAIALGLFPSVAGGGSMHTASVADAEDLETAREALARCIMASPMSQR